MISVAAIRMQQFGVHSIRPPSASDIDKLVRFEVLSYQDRRRPVCAAEKGRATVKDQLGSAGTPHRLE
jgi:hypothetical protein